MKQLPKNRPLSPEMPSIADLQALRYESVWRAHWQSGRFGLAIVLAVLIHLLLGVGLYQLHLNNRHNQTPLMHQVQFVPDTDNTAEEERQKAEEEAKKREEEQREAEEQLRKAEEHKKEEEKVRAAEERMKEETHQKVEAEAKQKEEELKKTQEKEEMKKKEKEETEKKRKEEEEKKRKKEEEKKLKEEEARKKKESEAAQKKADEDARRDDMEANETGIVQKFKLPNELNSWASLLQRKVERSWQIPGGLALDREDNSVTVSFWLTRNGAIIEGPNVVSGNADSILARSAVAAIRGAEPLPHLPEAFKEPEQQVVYVFTLNNGQQ